MNTVTIDFTATEVQPARKKRKNAKLHRPNSAEDHIPYPKICLVYNYFRNLARWRGNRGLMWCGSQRPVNKGICSPATAYRAWIYLFEVKLLRHEQSNGRSLIRVIDIATWAKANCRVCAKAAFDHENGTAAKTSHRENIPSHRETLPPLAPSHESCPSESIKTTSSAISSAPISEPSLVEQSCKAEAVAREKSSPESASVPTVSGEVKTQDQDTQRTGLVSGGLEGQIRDLWLSRWSSGWSFHKTNRNKLNALLQEYNDEQILEAWTNFLRKDTGFLNSERHPFNVFASQIAENVPSVDQGSESVGRRDTSLAESASADRRTLETAERLIREPEIYVGCWVPYDAIEFFKKHRNVLPAETIDRFRAALQLNDERREQRLAKEKARQCALQQAEAEEATMNAEREARQCVLEAEHRRLAVPSGVDRDNQVEKLKKDVAALRVRGHVIPRLSFEEEVEYANAGS